MSQLLPAPMKFEKTSWNRYYVFLSGSMGNWRKEVLAYFENFSDVLIFLDPTRDDWSSDWEEEQIKDQVFWELNGLEQADLVTVYFEKEAQASISLLEMGVSMHYNDVVIGCEEGFWAQNNVRHTADFYEVPCVSSVEELCNEIEQRFFKYEQDRKRILIIN